MLQVNCIQICMKDFALIDIFIYYTFKLNYYWIISIFYSETYGDYKRDTAQVLLLTKDDIWLDHMHTLS